MKQIVKKFNNQVIKTIFKVENKTNNNFKISNFNKYIISAVSLLFFYLFYLSIPILYDKTWVQTNIESKLLDEFKVNLSTSGNISYRILPAPHFLIKNSILLIDVANEQKSIAEIKTLKVFINQANFFDKKKINLKEVIANDVNFSLLRENLVLLDNTSNNKFSNKKIKINNSNIFLKDSSGETIVIIKIIKALLFFDNQKLFNLFNMNGEVFNIPFNLIFENKLDTKKYKKINIKANDLKLNILNESVKENDKVTKGKNIISFLNSSITTKYNIEGKSVLFASNNSRINNPQANYNGKLSINPFDFEININLGNHRISRLFDSKPIISEFVKSGLLFNDNMSLKATIVAGSKEKDEIFQNTKINIRIVNGKINFNGTRFNNEMGYLELNNSNFFLKNNNLVLNTNVLINIKNSSRLFSFLNTNKSSRKNLKNIMININYDFFTNQIEFNNVKIDNKEVSDKLFTIIGDFKDNNANNLNRSRRLINELLAAYEG